MSSPVLRAVYSFSKMQIFSVFILISFSPNIVNCVIKHCCPQNFDLWNSISCYCFNGKKINLSCDFNETVEYLIIQTEEYLTDELKLMDKLDKKYCLGHSVSVENQSSYSIIYCDSSTGDVETRGFTLLRDKYFIIVVLILFLANIISMVSSAITVYLYFWLPNLQDVHGTCVFHFSLNIAILHSAMTYYSVTGFLLFPKELCFIETPIIVMGEGSARLKSLVIASRKSKFTIPISSGIYFVCIRNRTTDVIYAHVISFILLAAYTWSIILSYNTWRQVNPNRTIQIDLLRRLNCYRILGYGVPFIIVGVMIADNPMGLTRCIHAFLDYVMWPAILTTFVNIFYFTDAQRRSSSLCKTNARQENNDLFLKKLKYKINMNFKLCLLMNIPFGVLVVLLYVVEHFQLLTNKVILQYAVFVPMFLLASLEGMLIFLAAVAFRKRVIKGFINHGQNSCVNCLRSKIPASLRNMRDEEETKYEDESVFVQEQATEQS